ncbi:MAG: methylated-DNA--[protein]-cysteine S-methyltransferase [Anaerolineales bacterium]
MNNRRNKDEAMIRDLRESIPEPADASLQRSRSRVQAWFKSAAEKIFWDSLETPVGRLHLAATDRGLIEISFLESSEAFLRRLDPKSHLIQDGPALARYRRQLQEYFDGRRRAFSLPTDLSSVTEFQRLVLIATSRIPAGEVRSYGEIAEAIGRPRAARAVGQALGGNPIPIVLPCHRVVTSSGRLGGYAGGLKRKRTLLMLEGALPLT